MTTILDQQIAGAKDKLESFLRNRDDKLQSTDDIMSGRPRQYTVFLEPQTGRTIFAFRKSRRYWAGTPEELQLLVAALQEAIRAGDTYRNEAKEVLDVEIPEDLDETIDNAFDCIDIQAIAAHPDFVMHQTDKKS